MSNERTPCLCGHDFAEHASLHTVRDRYCLADDCECRDYTADDQGLDEGEK